MAFKLNFYFYFGNEIKALKHDIYSKLAIKMQENRKGKKCSVKFGNLRKGIIYKYFKIKKDLFIYYWQVEVPT